MRTDSFFPRFFREFPEAFFTVIGEDEQKARGYKFRLFEVKEQSFRFDGTFLPKLNRKEIEKMFEPYLSDIRKSRAYREIAREGKREGKREVAKTLLQEKMRLAFVAKVTGFSPQEVRAIKKELETRKN